MYDYDWLARESDRAPLKGQVLTSRLSGIRVEIQIS